MQEWKRYTVSTNKNEAIMKSNEGQSQTCGACRKWQESKIQCPGLGYCGDEKAKTTMVQFNVPLSVYLLPANQACRL